MNWFVSYKWLGFNLNFKNVGVYRTCVWLFKVIVKHPKGNVHVKELELEGETSNIHLQTIQR